MDVESVITKDIRSGCRTEDLTIRLTNPFCNRQQPGVDIGCQEECAAILYKGADARRYGRLQLLIQRWMCA